MPRLTKAALYPAEPQQSSTRRTEEREGSSEEVFGPATCTGVEVVTVCCGPSERTASRNKFEGSCTQDKTDEDKEAGTGG